MGDFFFSACTHLLNRHAEVQVLPRKWVIAVYGDIVVLYLGNTDRNRPLIGIRLELHTDLEVFNSLKTIARNHLL